MRCLNTKRMYFKSNFYNVSSCKTNYKILAKDVIAMFIGEKAMYKYQEWEVKKMGL